MIKIGTYSIGHETLSFEERLRMTKAAGFDFLCFGVSAVAKGAGEGTVPDLCAKAGLEIGHIHLTGAGTHALWDAGEEGDAIEKRYCDEIVLCGEAGVKTAVLHALYGYAQPAPMGEVGLSRFLRIAECAEKNGVVLGVENSLYDDYLCYLLDHIKSPYFGFCFDSGHHNAFAREMDLLGKYGDRLVTTHLQDNDGTKDMHMYPLDGTTDWDTIGKALGACPHAHEEICAEIVRVRDNKFKGMSAADLETKFADTRAYRDGMLRFTDEHVIAYESLSFEESLARLYAEMREIADGIEGR